MYELCEPCPFKNIAVCYLVKVAGKDNGSACTDVNRQVQSKKPQYVNSNISETINPMKRKLGGHQARRKQFNTGPVNPLPPLLLLP